VIAPEEMDGLGILKFIGEEKGDDFDAEGTPIDEISQEEVLFSWRTSIFLKNIEQIVELTICKQAYP
jgi:hypothetical protein